MRDTTQVVARLDRDLVRELDSTAAEDVRSRTGQLEYLARVGLAGRRRLKELEQLAADGIARSRAANAPSTAGAEHLREHARMCGYGTDNTNTEESKK